jgi:hypothetical protein
MKLLRLIAFDEDDLKILSAHLQDALLRLEDMAFLPREHRFAAVLKRFDWLSAQSEHPPSDRFYERREAALRFDRVLGAQLRQLDLSRKGEVEELLAVNFEPTEPPSGYVELIFAGGGAIRLHVECIEAELRDLGPVWRTRRMPEHAAGAVGETRADDSGGDSPAASG